MAKSNMNVQQIAYTHLSKTLSAAPLNSAAVEKLTGKKPTDRQLKKSQEKFTAFTAKLEKKLAKINEKAAKREAKRLAKEAKTAAKGKKANAKAATKKAVKKAPAKKAAAKK